MGAERVGDVLSFGVCDGGYIARLGMIGQGADIAHAVGDGNRTAQAVVAPSGIQPRSIPQTRQPTPSFVCMAVGAPQRVGDGGRARDGRVKGQACGLAVGIGLRHHAPDPGPLRVLRIGLRVGGIATRQHLPGEQVGPGWKMVERGAQTERVGHGGERDEPGLPRQQAVLKVDIAIAVIGDAHQMRVVDPAGRVSVGEIERATKTIHDPGRETARRIVGEGERVAIAVLDAHQQAAAPERTQAGFSKGIHLLLDGVQQIVIPSIFLQLIVDLIHGDVPGAALLAEPQQIALRVENAE